MKAFTHLSETILDLIDQGEEAVLVLRCRDLDVPLVHKVIEQVDQNSPSDVCLSFAQPFLGRPITYIDALLDSLDQQIAGVNVLRAENGLPPWASLPASCFEGIPTDCLQTAVAHVGELVGTADDHRVLWAFVPTTIAEPVVWAQIVGLFLDKTTWRPGHRVVIRGDVDALVEAIRKDGSLSAFVLDVDFSPEAMASDLAASVAAPETPPKERHLKLMTLAGMDIAHKRYVEAIRKYGSIYAFFDGMEDSEGIRAMCLLQVGDIARMVGDSKLAKKRYQQALALSVGGVRDLYVAMIACSNLGELPALVVGPSEAIGYLTVASEIAGKLCNLPYKTATMEKIGLVWHAIGERDKAKTIWKQALALARDGCEEERASSLAAKLRGSK